MDDDLHIFGCIVINFPDLDLSFVVGCKDGIDQAAGIGSEWYFDDRECLFIDLPDPGPDPDPSPAQSVIVFRKVGQAAGREIGQDVKRFVFKETDRGIDEFEEVVGQDFGCQSNGDAFNALCQQKGEFHRQGDRFPVAAVVRKLPFGGFGIKDYIQGEFRQPCLDISCRRSGVAGMDIAPVTLGFDEQVFLSELHQCIPDGGISVRVVFHGMPDDVGHLVETPVIHVAHRMQYPSLNGFQSIVDIRHGPFEDHIGSIIEEPVLIHSVKLDGVVLGLLTSPHILIWKRNIGSITGIMADAFAIRVQFLL